jgi:hypothetical protein
MDMRPNLDFESEATDAGGLKSLKWLVRSVPRVIGHSCFGPRHDPERRYNILVVGVCVGQKTNYLDHIKAEFNRSEVHSIRQKWFVIDPSERMQTVNSERLVQKVITRGIPKTLLINSLIEDEDLSRVDYLFVVDDDIKLPDGFLNAYIATVSKLGFALSQPARTYNSYISHPITKRVPELFGRRTFFVEIGPVVCFSKSLFSNLLPFDEGSPMGFGLDLVWPIIVEDMGLTMGIIDSVPVDHSLRPPGTNYNSKTMLSQMGEFLSGKAHASPEEISVTLVRFPVQGSIRRGL